jgi:CelD/BcsL family acetyltransferase involved in cellulose biosynthesis
VTRIDEINDPAGLDALAPAWSRLLEQTAGATFCHSLAWLQTYWKHFGSGKRLRVLVVREGDEAVGILPLVVRTSRRSEPVSFLAYAFDGWGNYYGPIGPDPRLTLTAGLEHVLRTRRHWNFIELEGVNSHWDGGSTRAAFEAAGIRATCEAHDGSAIVDLAAHGSWDAYCQSHKSKWRNDVKRQEKKLAKRGAVTYLRHRTSPGGDTDPRWDLYDACEAISRASWQASATSGTMLSKDAYRAFFRDCHAAAAASGAADLHLLYVDEQPVAFCLCTHYRGYVAQEKTAYDPAFAQEGSGAVIQARALADSFAHGDHTYDLGSDAMEWKQFWLTDVRAIYRYVHFPSAVVAQVVRGKRALERRWFKPPRRIDARSSVAGPTQPIEEEASHLA